MTEPTSTDLPQSGGSWVRQPDGSLTPADVPPAETAGEIAPTVQPVKPTPRGKAAAPEKE